MASYVPSGCVDLRTAYGQIDKALNVMGVVVDFLEPVKSNGPDCVITFTLHDPSWGEEDGLKFKFFNRFMNKLPAVAAKGDVVLLRNVKIKLYNHQPIGLSNSATTWGVFPESSIPMGIDELPSGEIESTKSSDAFHTSRAETEYAILLCNSRNRQAVTCRNPPTSLQVKSTVKENGGAMPKQKEKFSLVRDLELSTNTEQLVFADLLGEVRKLHANDYRLELSITDYTVHKELYNYAYGCDDEGADGDVYGYMNDMQKQWPGPWGKMTITVTLWDRQADFARAEVKEGAFVLLRNVQITRDRDGKRMEGKLRGDRRFSDKVNVQLLKTSEAGSNSRMLELLKRKKEYEKRAKIENKRFLGDMTNVRKRAWIPEGDAEQPETKLSKRKKNDRKKKEKIMEISEAAQNGEVARLDINAHVRCNNHDVPLKLVDEIVDTEILRRKTPNGNDFYLPFQNCRYHSKVHVVDFWPDDIGNFAAPYCESQYELLSDDEDSGGVDINMGGAGDEKWEWRFFLLVEDASSPAIAGQPKAQMELLVAGDDGDCLLDMDASDLRKDPRKLAQMREKLFVLWGDLQERKAAAGVENEDKISNIRPSAKPFECLIKEYGIRSRNEKGQLKGELDFDRMFRIWGTTIVSLDAHG